MRIIKEPKLSVKTSKFTISLDNKHDDCDYCFLSHAHSDHLFNTKKKVLCSKETSELSKLRNHEVNKLRKDLNGVKLVNSGHILGSKSLIIKEDGRKLIFTSDYTPRSRSFLKGFKPEECEELIIESTFGKPSFLFPNFEDEIKRAEDFIESNLRKDYLTVMMGYPLGKIQELQHSFKDYTRNFHKKIKIYNQFHNECGVEFGRMESVDDCDVLFTPVMKASDDYFNSFKRERGVKFAVFSGWNTIPSYKKRFGADKGFTISDHADFKELMNTVHECSPEKIYVNHGSSDELTRYLRIEDYNAESL